MPNESKPGMFGIPADGATPAPAAAPAQQPQGQPASTPAPATQPGQPATPAPGATQPAAAPVSQPGSPAQPATQPTQPGQSAPATGSPESDRASQYAKHILPKYQKAMEWLGANYPAVRDELQGVINPGSQAPAQPAQPATQPAAQPVPGAAAMTGQQLADKAPDPIEDPQGYAHYVAQLTAAEYNRMRQAERAHEQRASTLQQLQQERNQVIARWNEYVAPSGSDPNAADYFSGVPQDVQEKALATINQYGINVNAPGGPSAYFRAFVNEVDRIMSKQTVNQRTTEIAAQASQQATMLNNMSQPAPTGSLTPGEKSPEEQHLEKMQGVRTRTLSDLAQRQGT